MTRDALCYKRCLIAAIVFHVFVFSVLLFSFHGKSPAPIAKKSTKIVHAVTVDGAAVDKEIARIKQEKLDKIAHEKALAAKARAEKKRLADLKKQQAAAKKKRVAEKKAQALALKKLEAKKAAAKKKQAEVAKQQALEKAQADKLKKQADERVQAEKDRKEQQLKAAELQKKLAAETAQSQAIEGEVNKYKALIIEAISQKWLVPIGTNSHVSCQLYIHLAPGGMVVNVTVTKSSGNALLDRSAIAAVYKASPLPVPIGSKAFDEFRQFQLTVKPEGYISGV